MGAERHDRTIEIFNDALEVDSGERSAFLQLACGGDTRLLREVRSLLTAEKKVPTSGLLAPRDPRDAATDAGPGSPAALLGERVGSYTVLDVLGEGGMGVVYRAEQASPQRAVALKVIRPGRLGRHARRRFEYEADVLGRLHHPGIAQVYEAGTAETPHGACPFFAMELVEGRPLTEHADAQGLGLRERLALMAHICDAVDHAHQNGVIHRDLKPGNILIDAEGRPKVLDFGVARAVDSDVALTTMRTDVGELIGTLHYMSPEQCDGDPRRIDTRSDIYALGVVCWELLAGALPYDVKGKPLPEALRVIREEAPRTLGSMTGVLRGDVETIVGKAIEKDREQRYQSASSLASDIRRFLRHEPIVARPPSTLYHLGRFAKRHRGLVASFVAVFVVLVAGIVATSWQAVRATRGWRTADFRQFDDTQSERKHTAAMTAIIRAGPPDEESLERILTDLERTGRGAVAREVRSVAADIFGRLGYFDRAEFVARRAWELSREERGERHPGTLYALDLRNDLVRRAGSLDTAATDIGRALDHEGFVLGTETQYLDTEARCSLALRYLGMSHTLAQTRLEQGRLDEAEAMLGKLHAGALILLEGLHSIRPEIQGRIDARHDSLVLMVRRTRGSLLLERGDAGEAESIFRDLLAIDRATRTGRDSHVEGDTSPLAVGDALVIAGLHRELAEALVARGQLTEAEPLLVEASDRLIAEYGHESPASLRATSALGRLRLAQGRVDEASALLASVVEIADARYPDHWRTAVFRGEHAVALARQGRHHEARVALARARDRLTRLFGPDDYRVARLAGE